LSKRSPLGTLSPQQGTLSPQQEISEESDLRSPNSEAWSLAPLLEKIPEDHCTKQLENTEEMYKSQVKEYFGDLITDLNRGQMFGELALLHAKPRNATVITNEPTKMLV
jgi:hypothetical protein